MIEETSIILQELANVAAIFGAISIFLTLIFVVIELRKTFEQFRHIREIHLHDVQNQFFLFWSTPENADLVLDGRKNFAKLTEREQYRFESYVEMRIRFLVYGFNIVDEKNRIGQMASLQHFFNDPGVMTCYRKMDSEKRIPLLGSKVIEEALLKNI